MAGTKGRRAARTRIRRRRPRTAPARARKQPAQGRRRKRRAAPRSLARLLYWALVLGVVGRDRRRSAASPGSASTLPPIQSLEVPKRPPTIEIVGLDGRPLATRGEMGGADVPIKELPPYLPKAFIAIEDRRFYSHHGVDPVGLARAGARQRAAPRRVAGRLHHHPAARQEPVPDPGAHALAQDAGTGARALARAQIQQGGNSRALSQSRLFRRRRLRRRSGGATLFRQVRARR